MKSKIAELIKLSNHPVAILQSDVPIEADVIPKEGIWSCVAGMVVAVTRGKSVMYYLENTGCLGGKTGLGFQDYPHGWIENYLSDGGGKLEDSEYYKKSVEHACAFIDGIRRTDGKKYTIMKPLESVTEEDRPLAVIFLVNADQLSALATLANYDTMTQDNVKMLFGAGCTQSILYPMEEERSGGTHCFIGMTDPSARKCLDKDLLAFSMPFSRFLALENEAENSFLTKATWQKISARI